MHAVCARRPLPACFRCLNHTQSLFIGILATLLCMFMGVSHVGVRFSGIFPALLRPRLPFAGGPGPVAMLALPVHALLWQTLQTHVRWGLRSPSPDTTHMSPVGNLVESITFALVCKSSRPHFAHLYHSGYQGILRFNKTLDLLETQVINIPHTRLKEIPISER